MYSKIIIVIASLLYIVLLPYMEISDTHVFSASWPGHARMHDVWQLATNASLAFVALWLVFKRNEIQLAATIIWIVTTAFVFAYLTRGGYGGDMFYTDGKELVIYGINPAFGIMVVLSVLLGFVVYSERKKAKHFTE